MFHLEIQNECAAALPDPAWLVDCAQLAYQGELQGSAVLRIVGPDEARTLNHEFRDKDYATNILSFPSDFSDLPEGVLDDEEAGYLGDLVVCADIIADEAKQQSKSVAHHWAHLVVHGILHLQGYDHIEEDEAALMESLEIKLLGKIGVPDPYNETEAS
ncbi:rRNA maturation RNase YbeY [Leucothrix pacifica]|uniref:Endoribonuclease YbeY n=1 Tax=Leucothrix pacifica TaxID=1247513 RepID=A0A317CF49_9GAMM|nr:rRNA maturation RNase YbeY [Leucothrix pacifica]PWQ97198.1 rRNA maturation RNase YbeY [Leucothrix pacifica]